MMEDRFLEAGAVFICNIKYKLLCYNNLYFMFNDGE